MSTKLYPNISFQDCQHDLLVRFFFLHCWLWNKHWTCYTLVIVMGISYYKMHVLVSHEKWDANVTGKFTTNIKLLQLSLAFAKQKKQNHN